MVDAAQHLFHYRCVVGFFDSVPPTGCAQGRTQLGESRTDPGRDLGMVQWRTGAASQIAP